METENYVKRQKIKNLISNIVLIIFCVVNFCINYNDYYMVLTKDYKMINTINDVDTKTKYFYINMQGATKSNYVLENSSFVSEIYTLTIDNKKVLVALKQNTILTDKISVEIIKDKTMLYQLNDKFDSNNYAYYFSNIDLSKNVKVQLYKAYVLLGVMFISLIFGIINIIGIINPKNTYMYKKLINDVKFKDNCPKIKKV